MQAVSERLSVLADMHSQRQIAENVLKAYLGPQTGPLVLAGKIRRGTGDTINAVLWSSDVRSFTALSDRVPGQQVIAILDKIFDAQARAIAKHGGEILKFIGDGLLAIFPVEAPDQAARAATEALTAAREAMKSVQALGPHAPGEAPLKMVIALHYGSAIYGNIGAADRLDFTVIGPGVNLVSRIEAVAKSLDLPLVVSDDFARVHGGELRSLGLHKLRGLEQPHELFTRRIEGCLRGVRSRELLPGNSRNRRFELHRNAVQDRLPDHGFDIAVVRPVVHGNAGACRGDLLPAHNVPVPPTVRQADHALHHFIGDVDGDRSAITRGSQASPSHHPSRRRVRRRGDEREARSARGRRREPRCCASSCCCCADRVGR